MDEIKVFRDLVKTMDTIKREFGSLLESKSDLTMTQWCVLKEIRAAEDNITSKDLERLTNTDKATMSEMLSKLVKKGYIIKEQDKKDRRKFNITMPDRHNPLCDKIIRLEREYFSKLFEGFTEQDYNDVDKFMNKIGKGSACNGK